MDPDLEVDLAEALDGLDPVELLLEDPLLQTVASEVFDLASDGERIQDVTTNGEDLLPVFNVEDSNSNSSDGATPSPGGSSGYPSSVESDPLAAVKLDKKSQNKSGIDGIKALCVACQKPARGYRYYGVVVCNGCRAFFARSVKDDTYSDFICDQEAEAGQCLTNSKSYAICQKCRFDRCIEVGMLIPNKKKSSKKKPSVKSGGCGEIIEAVEMIVQKSQRMLQPTNTWSLAEKRSMEAIVSSQFRRGHVDMTNIVLSNMDVFEAALENLYHGKCFPLRLNKLYEDYINYSAGRTYVDSDELAFDRLGANDKLRLVQGNFPLVSEFVMACKMNQVANRGEVLEAYFASIINGASDPKSKQRFNSIYQRVSLTSPEKTLRAFQALDLADT